METVKETTIEDPPLMKKISRFDTEFLFFVTQFVVRSIITLITFTAISLIALADHALSHFGFRLLLCADAIVFCYTLISFAWFWSPYSKESNSKDFIRAFYFDVVAAVVLSFGCGAAAPGGNISEQDQSWFSLCSGVCTKSTVALDLSKIACFCFLNLAFLVIFRLLLKAYT